jgi:hypothetical protein
MMDAMRKLHLGTALTLAIAFVSPASAMPAGYPLLRDAAVSIDLIEVGDAKVGVRPRFRPFGWSPPARWASAAMAAHRVTGRRAGVEPSPSSPAVHLADGSGNWSRA